MPHAQQQQDLSCKYIADHELDATSVRDIMLMINEGIRTAMEVGTLMSCSRTIRADWEVQNKGGQAAKQGLTWTRATRVASFPANKLLSLTALLGSAEYAVSSAVRAFTTCSSRGGDLLLTLLAEATCKA